MNEATTREEYQRVGEGNTTPQETEGPRVPDDTLTRETENQSVPGKTTNRNADPHDPDETSADHAWRILVAEELGACRKMLLHIQERVETLRETIDRRFDQHQAYHEKNEIRWGPTKWLDGQPGRLIFIALLLLIATTANVTIEQLTAMLQAIPVEP